MAGVQRVRGGLVPNEAEDRQWPDQTGSRVHWNKRGLNMRAMKSQLTVLMLLEETGAFLKEPTA